MKSAMAFVDVRQAISGGLSMELCSWRATSFSGIGGVTLSIPRHSRVSLGYCKSPV